MIVHEECKKRLRIANCRGDGKCENMGGLLFVIVI